MSYQVIVSGKVMATCDTRKEANAAASDIDRNNHYVGIKRDYPTIKTLKGIN